jgi:hypothetical protein
MDMKNGNTCRVRSARALKVMSGGKAVRATKPEKEVWEFKTTAGAAHVLTPEGK